MFSELLLGRVAALIAGTTRATCGSTATFQIAAASAFRNRARLGARAFQVAAPARAPQIAGFRSRARDIAAPTRAFEATVRAIGTGQVTGLLIGTSEVAIAAGTCTSTGAFLRATAPKPRRAGNEPDNEKSKDSFHGHISMQQAM